MGKNLNKIVVSALCLSSGYKDDTGQVSVVFVLKSMEGNHIGTPPTTPKIAFAFFSSLDFFSALFFLFVPLCLPVYALSSHCKKKICVISVKMMIV